MSLEGTTGDLSHDGYGVVKSGDRVYFVDGTLPGEVITFEPRRKRRGRFDGRLESILSASADRVEPRCEYFGTCGGCALQHLDLDAQFAFKQKQLQDNLERIGKIVPEDLIEGIRGPAWGYRRKARLGVKLVPKKGGILVGFRERGNSYITSLQQCPTLDQRIACLLPGLHELVTEMDNNHRIPQIEVAAGDSEVALVFRHLEALSDSDCGRLRQFAVDNDLQVLSQPGGLDSVVPIWPENPGPLSYVVEDCVIEFQATDFTQVNVDVNRQMVRQAVEQLDLSSRDRVVDLFCGVGNFTLPIAATCEAVLGVEGDEYLVRAGSSNAELNAIQNVEFRRLNLHQDNLEEFFRGGNYNKMLLDPPRSGALDVVSSVVPVLQPEKIVYVSCNPATLARDADVLVNKGGYRLVRAGAIDMFPHTAHVESMAVFDRG